MATRITADLGLAGLTVRTLASELGVTPMALYRHVADRDGLVRLVTDRIGAAVRPVFPADASWEDQARAWAQAQRWVLRQHRGIAAWLMDNGPAGESAYRLFDVLASTLCEAGFDDATASRGTSLIMSWTFSRIAIEDNADARNAARRPGRASAFVDGLADLDPDDYPRATRLGVEFFTLDPTDIFEAGLGALLVGLRAQLVHPGQ
ncbi:MAG: TetR/AcrR family transcriptional regulator [Acidimicrobiales bacterium]